MPSARSSHALPKLCRDLMESPDSPIIDFYPEDFEVDMDGCRYAWQGVAILPFIDENRLMEAIKSIEDTFTDEEKNRNSLGPDLIFVHRKSSAISEQLLTLINSSEPAGNIKLENDNYKSIFGLIFPSSCTIYHHNDLANCYCFEYMNPEVPVRTQTFPSH
jgi:5'-3' exoribonuclease 2